MHSDSTSVNLVTPIAVFGEDLESVSRQLEDMLSAPSAEMEVRRTLGQLETRILQELRQGDEPGSITSSGRR